MRLEAIYADGDRHFVTLRLILNGCTNDYWLRFLGELANGLTSRTHFRDVHRHNSRDRSRAVRCLRRHRRRFGRDRPGRRRHGWRLGTTAPDGGGTGGGSGETEK